MENRTSDACVDDERVPGSLAKRLANAESLNARLEAEVDSAASEAFLAREALEECAAHAMRSLQSQQTRQSGGYRASTSEAVERAEADAEALAEALVASELALEAVLGDRDKLASELTCARTSAAQGACTSMSDAGDRPGLEAEMQELSGQLLEAQKENRRLSMELACAHRDENARMEALESNLAEQNAQRDAEWTKKLQFAEDEVKRLRCGLNAIWTESEASAGEFASSLLEVQAHMMQMHGSIGVASPTSAYSAGYSDSAFSGRAGGFSPPLGNGFQTWHH